MYPDKVKELKTAFEQWEKNLQNPRWKSPRVTEISVDGKKVSFQP
jgi:hypothetical protein